MKISEFNYTLKKDIGFILNAEQKNFDDLSFATGVSRTTLKEIYMNDETIPNVCEKIYSYIYKCGYRLNSVKEDFTKELHKDKVLFHGSKNGLSDITALGSRKNCDFGYGFYLGESYDQALSFVCENKESSVYSFVYEKSELNIVEFEVSLEWMLAICYYRGTLEKYKNHPIIAEIKNKIENADIVISPIADNRMFYVMTLFTDGQINTDAALHSLSASKLGKQYIFKTDKGLDCLKPIEKYYICEEEKNDCIERLKQRSFEIETKLKLATREFKNGLYIEELLK